MSPLSFYKCLADDTRLKILLLLVTHKSLCVCDLIDALSLSQPKISRHLADLRKCNVVEAQRQGKWMYYQLHTGLPEWAQRVLKTTEQANQDYMQEAYNRLEHAMSNNCQETSS
ncbi:metalloregulator ArsR/SmtB family transcription factor [Salinimonas iocasae]|uniref:Metalloregulator ArsR/SmtB family transcription factor n=1 Tax=Salinimonas iocasae TaxID=2572577 RepID=A0A5B7YH26_9ALTE|nr:metalloregulator ArsR/SmtB family transcription factor [Salinimonas iocasae]QCZ94904.1 metalloregulator ArsR/SmtB family transcription factor [Salinimonas iocasae]